MKIKVDENLPSDLVHALRKLGHNTDSVPLERLAGASDETVWEAAQASGRFLITQDLDFSDVRRYQPGSHEGLLLVRLREPNRRSLIKRVQTLFEAGDVESWRRCFVIATDRKIRVRRPLKA